ncbi:MAG: MBG domain-containing protein [Candidatus Omnitrophota bacterium]
MFKKCFVLIATIIFSLNYSLPLYALPEGENVVSGSANFTRLDENTLNISTSDRVIINYDSFSIAEPEAVHFLQPSSQSVALNRVVGVNPSEILGVLTANGKIYLINPNGILFGPNSQVDTAGLVASTLDIKDSDFLNGNLVFIKNVDKVGASVINQGYIQAKEAILLGSAVKNEGQIVTTLGTTVLASGEKITLGLDTAGMISVVIDEAVKNEISGVSDGVKNTGKIAADGGLVVLTAKALDNVFDYAVNNEGIIQANALDASTGKVELVANQRVNVAGKIEARGGEVVIDAAGADLAGSIFSNTTDIILHNQAVHINDVLTSGVVTVSDVGDIYFDGNYIVEKASGVASLTVTSGVGPIPTGETGSFYQADGKTIAVDGDIDISGYDIFLANIISGNDLTVVADNTINLKSASSIKVANDISMDAGDDILINADIVLSENNTSLNAIGDIIQANTSEIVAGGNVDIAGNNITLNDIYLGGDFTATADGSMNLLGLIEFAPITFTYGTATITTTSIIDYGDITALRATNEGEGYGLKFDLSSVPNTITVTSAEIYYYTSTSQPLESPNVKSLSEAQLIGLQDALETHKQEYHYNDGVVKTYGKDYPDYAPYIIIHAVVTTDTETNIPVVTAYTLGDYGGTLGFPTNVSGGWSSSGDKEIDVSWNLPTQDTGYGTFTANVRGNYVMNSGSEINTNGGDASITAGGDVTLTLVDAENGDVSITSGGSIIDGDLGVAPTELDIIGHTITLSALNPFLTDDGNGGKPVGAIDLGYPYDFSYIWDEIATTDVTDVSPDSYTASFSGGEWTFYATSPTRNDTTAGHYFHVATVSGSEYSDTADLGPFGTLKITAEDQTKTYGSTFTFDTTTPSDDFTVDGLLGTDSVSSVNLYSAGAAPTATVISPGPNYDIVPSNAVITATLGPGMLNKYYVTYVNGTLEVNKADAIILVTPYNVVYDGTAHTATGSATGVLGETLTGLDLSGTTHTNAGSYTDTWTFTDVTGNYNDASNTINDIIAKAALTVTANDTSKDYGQPDPIFTYQITSGSLVEGDSFSGALTREPGEDVGIYDILQGTLTAGDNYAIDYIPGIFTILAAIIPPAPAPEALIYDYLTERWRWPVQEIIGTDTGTRVYAMDPQIRPIPVYFYHPVTPTDTGAFEGLALTADMYEFIENNIRARGESFFPWLEEEFKKRR